MVYVFIWWKSPKDNNPVCEIWKPDAAVYNVAISHATSLYAMTLCAKRLNLTFARFSVVDNG